jgi:pyridinium-3,5-bisthiocarboxylic acid mononucleotide nickel chelatase
MKVAYLDCSGGISGVAALAALIDAGADVDSLSKELEFLGGDAPILRTEDVVLGEFRVRRVSVEGGNESVGRRPADLEAVLSAGGLPDAARDLALRIYGRLAEAEARVHGSTPEAVRFHEVGSLRSVVGVVGTALAIEQLGIERIVASPVPYGRGMVDTEHGRLAVPTPATLELLRGVPVEPQEMSGELVTPTGAAILTVAATTFGQIPAMTIESVGYGTGDLRNAPIVLRVVVGSGEVERESQGTSGTGFPGRANHPARSR